MLLRDGELPRWLPPEKEGPRPGTEEMGRCGWFTLGAIVWRIEFEPDSELGVEAGRGVGEA
jgi:hypothetical protein